MLSLLLLGFVAQAGAQNQQAIDPQAIMERVVNRDQSNWERTKNYTWFSRETVHEKDSKGNVKKTERSVHEVLIVYGQPYEKMVEKDGKPLQGDQARKEQEKLDKLIAKRQKETESERARRVAEFEKERKRQREFAREIPRAFMFRLEREEVYGGFKTWVIEAKPRPGYTPQVAHAGLLKKFQGRIWVDQNEYQLVRLEAQAIDTVSVGWVLARIAKGTNLALEQTRVNDEVWLPKSLQVTLDARIALLKRMQGDLEVLFDTYRKFQTESKIVAAEEAQND